MYFRKIAPRTNFSFWEAHHFFTGYAIWIIGFYFIFHINLVFGILISILGAWITLDDNVQHTKQAIEIKKDGFYTSVSFWHWFPYLILYKLTKKEKYKEEF